MRGGVLVSARDRLGLDELLRQAQSTLFAEGEAAQAQAFEVPGREGEWTAGA
jgi:hypothetical protein